MAKNKSLGIGVIGMGNIAQTHIAAIQQVRGARLTACYSRDAEKARTRATEYGCRAHTTLKGLLADPEVDIVCICTPSGSHQSPALAAARAGKHVIIEKPLEVTPARCKKLVDTCRDKRVRLATVFQSRFLDANRELKRAMEEKRIGKPVNCSAYIKWLRPQSYYDSADWRGTWALDGGGCLMNQGSHTVDLLIWLMGEDPIEVSAFMNRPTHKRIEVETNIVAILKFKSGALGTIEASTEIHPGYPKEIQISGTKGSVSTHEEDLVRWDFATPKSRDAKVREQFSEKSGALGGSATQFVASCEGHRRQFQEFVDVLNGKKRTLTCDGKEGLRSVRLISAIYKSAREGRPVRIRG